MRLLRAREAELSVPGSTKKASPLAEEVASNPRLCVFGLAFVTCVSCTETFGKLDVALIAWVPREFGRNASWSLFPLAICRPRRFPQFREGRIGRGLGIGTAGKPGDRPRLQAQAVNVFPLFPRDPPVPVAAPRGAISDLESALQQPSQLGRLVLGSRDVRVIRTARARLPSWERISQRAADTL